MGQDDLVQIVATWGPMILMGALGYFAGLNRGSARQGEILKRHYKSRMGFVSTDPRPPAVGHVKISEANFRNPEKFSQED